MYCCFLIIFLIIWEISKNMTKTIHENLKSLPCFFHEWFINSQFNPCCDSDSLALLDLFISSDSNICSAIAFPSFWNFDHAAISVSVDIAGDSKQDALFQRIAYDYSGLDWEYLRDHLSDQKCSLRGYL